MAKVDLKSAFKMVPKPGLRMGTPWYILARAVLHRHLPPRSVPSIFNKFANAIHWILENNYGATILHYLDDFLLVGPPEQPVCQEAMSTMLQVCERMGVPVATEKCEGPATCITFLGIVLDSSLQQLRLPADKLQEISSHGLAYTKSQEGAPIAHWEACVCSQGSPSRTPVPMTPHSTLNHSEKAPSLHPSKL